MGQLPKSTFKKYSSDNQHKQSVEQLFMGDGHTIQFQGVPSNYFHVCFHDDGQNDSMLERQHGNKLIKQVSDAISVVFHLHDCTSKRAK